MRDFLPEDVRRRQYVIGVIAEVYQKYAFEPLETPAVENLETLQGKYGEEGDRLIFKILKRGEGGETGQADLALRYDVTVPLARVVAEHRAKLPKFFKRYQIQPVWRADRPQKGRFREFYQCDVDAIGSTSMTVEAELLSAAADVFLKLGFNDFQIVVNHRKLLNAVLQHAGVPADLQGVALVIMDKADKIGVDGVRKELADKGLADSVANTLLEQLSSAQPSDLAQWIGQQSSVLNDEGKQGLEDLRQIFALCQSTNAGAHLVLDRSLARGLSYYTGPIFEIRVPDLAGSLGGGGRYDNLIGMFSGENIPASGISLGLERILVVMGERKMFPESVVSTPADVMVVQWFANRTNLYLSFAKELRDGGLRVELYPDSPIEDGKKVGDKQFKYASARGIPFVAVIGGDELANETVAIKNMKTGEQKSVPRSEAVKWLSN
ncbi:MAG TPA: histidine--tRNA ligase [Vicinamibacterales bacterium]|nr:histidine--tRNA ligase [Vicinamibacterales bacterium]